MPSLRSYRDLDVWNMAMEFVEQIYQTTRMFPDTERFHMVDQLRRAVTSIPTNIAEGHGRSAKIFARHLDIALGSAAEADTLLELAHRLGYLATEDYNALMDSLTRIRKMLFRLRQSVLQSTK